MSATTASPLPNPFPAPVPIPPLKDERKDRTELPLPTPKPTPSQLTIIQMIYHQSPDRNPTGNEMRMGRDLVSDEQPYTRHTRIGEEWTPLDCGWIKFPGYLSIKNDGIKFRVNPTDEQRTDAQSKIIQIGIRVSATGCALVPGCGPYLRAFANVRPGESVSLDPEGVEDFVIRCVSGSAPVTISAYPR